MRKEKISTLILLTLCLTFCLYGETFNGPTTLYKKVYEGLVIHGPAKLKLVKADTLEVSGPLDFESLEVVGEAKVNGPVKGDKGKFGQLTVKGPLYVDLVVCEDLSVEGKVIVTSLVVNNSAEIEGELDATHSKFKSLIVDAEKITLDDVIAESIFVSKSENNQLLILKGRTEIYGDVTFESGNGVIDIQSPNVYIRGAMVGAQQKEKPKE